MRIVCVIFVFLFWQCSAPDYSEKLKFALQAARNNRPELEKVLAHYAAHPEDSLKWQAACFLIENMPGHYTAESDVLRAFRKRVDRDTVPYFSRKAFDVLISAIPEFNRYARKVEDVRHITADYLIRHIDASFELYGRFPWYENVPLADFFRYVLPYRIGNERLDLWRDSIKPTLPDEYWISSEIQSDYRKARQYLELGYDLNLHFTDTLVDQLYQKIAYECHYLNLKHLLRDRVLGIPSALDYFPHYANRNGLHYWVEDIDSRKRMPYIEGAAESQPANRLLEGNTTVVTTRKKKIYKNLWGEALYGYHLICHSVFDKQGILIGWETVSKSFSRAGYSCDAALENVVVNPQYHEFSWAYSMGEGAGSAVQWTGERFDISGMEHGTGTLVHRI